MNRVAEKGKSEWYLTDRNDSIDDFENTGNTI